MSPIFYPQHNTGLTLRTGRATLTLHSAITHLNHFCAVMPSAGYGGCLPVFETDPPEFPENWHSAPYRTTGTTPEVHGPFGATVHLPRHLPRELREFTTPRIHSNKSSAKRRVAFEAYKALYQFRGDKLLNDFLLPLSHIGEDMEALFAAGIEKRKGFSAAALQMSPWSSESGELRWWAFKLIIDQLQDMVLIVRRELPLLLGEELPVLYIPGRGEVKVDVEPLGRAEDLDFTLDDAREFTRRLLWRVPGSRSTLKWTETDFEYLLHPAGDAQDPIWDERWQWASKNTDGPPDDHFLAMDLFGRKFDYPSDITYVRTSRRRGDYRFIRWRNEPLSEKEEERIRQEYAKRKVFDLEITYPLLEVHDRGRKDFTVPFPAESIKVKSDVHHRDTELLVASHTGVFLASPDRSRWAGILPSLLRQMSFIYTVISFRETLLISTPLYDIPLDDLTTALTTPAAMAPTDYERMETLGDTVLKLLTCIQTMADHPFWHEGYLTARKDHVVANVSLARAATEKGLPQWIIRDKFIPTKWLPLLHQEDETLEDEGRGGEEEEEGEGAKQVDLSTKTIADVVEALIGASYRRGSFDLGMECLKLFKLGMEWQPLGESVEKIFSMVEALDDAELPMDMISSVERVLGYEFTKKTLAVEALTHPSYTLGIRTRPYDRLEFLGDAVLDMVVSDFLYDSEKNYSPGQMYIRKVAIVNQHFLAFVCLDAYTTTETFMARTLDDETAVIEREDNLVYLWQCLLQSNSHVMEDMAVTRARYEKGKETITKALKEGRIYPWAALTALQAPKFFSDIIESLLGAVYLDTRGNMEIVRKVLRTLGILPVLKRIVEEEVDVLHPVSRLAHWAAKSRPQKIVKYRFEIAEKRITCTIGMRDKPDQAGGEKAETASADLDKELETIAVAEAEYRGHGSNEEVKFEAAERAIQALEIREIRSLEDARMVIDT
jgi:endoribonuclease Dicer